MSVKFSSSDALSEWFATNGHNCRQTLDLDPKVVLKRLTIKEIQDHTNGSINSSEPIERDIKSLESQDYMRYLNLIRPKDLNTKPLNDLKKSFPVRDIDRIGVSVVDNETNEVIGDRLVIQTLNDLLIKPKPKRVVKRRRKSSARLIPKKIVKQKTNKTNDWFKCLQIKEKTRKQRFFQFISRLPFTSRLGYFLSVTLGFRRLSDASVESLADKHIDVNTYSQNTDLLKPNNRYINKFNKWLPNNIRLISQDMEFMEPLHRQDFHYNFTRRQYREKCLRRKSGLNWRSRLRSLRCKPTTLCLTALSDETLHELMSCDQQMVQSDEPTVNPMSPSESVSNESEKDFNLKNFLNKSMDNVLNQLDEEVMIGGGDTLVLQKFQIVLKRDPKLDWMAKSIAAKQWPQ